MKDLALANGLSADMTELQVEQTLPQNACWEKKRTLFLEIYLGVEAAEEPVEGAE